MNTLIQEKIKKDNILSKISADFPDIDVYVVGGTVRDFILGKNSYDRDIIVCTGDIYKFALQLSRTISSTLITLDDRNNIYRLILKEDYNKHNPYMIDITTPMDNSLERDLMRRDLTINSVAVNIHTGDIVDLFGGITDIKTNTLRHIDENNFDDDPLRLLRVYRFQASLGFDICPDTLHAICRRVHLIQKSAKERILYELMKLFDGKYADIALNNMNKTWLLEEILPIVKKLKQVPPNSHHHLNLFEHSIETVKHIQELYESSDDVIREHLNLIDFGGFRRLAHLKFAGFLHDIGKFSTWTIDEVTGRHRFIRHDDEGCKLVKPILKNLSCSNKQIEYISKMIKTHMYPSLMMQENDVNEKTMLRYCRKMGEDAIDNIILAKADRLSARGPAISDENIECNIKSLDNLVKFYYNSKEKLKPLPKLLDGHEISAITGKKGPELGAIIKKLKEEQAGGTIITREDAIKFISSCREC